MIKEKYSKLISLLLHIKVSIAGCWCFHCQLYVRNVAGNFYGRGSKNRPIESESMLRECRWIHSGVVSVLVSFSLLVSGMTLVFSIITSCLLQGSYEIRAYKITTTWKDFHNECQHFKQLLVNNNFTAKVQ